MRGNFKKGALYLVEFWDHCMGGAEAPARFNACGWVTKVDPDYVVITSWSLLNPIDEEDYDNNTEDSVILRSCIIKAKKLS